MNAVLAEAAADGGTVDSRIASVSLKLQTTSADSTRTSTRTCARCWRRRRARSARSRTCRRRSSAPSRTSSRPDVRARGAVRNATEGGHARGARPAARAPRVLRARRRAEAARRQAASRAAADALGGAFLADRGAADWRRRPAASRRSSRRWSGPRRC